MTETSPLAHVGRPPPGDADEEQWRCRVHAGPADVRRRGRGSSTTRRTLPNDGKAVGELEVRGPWIAGVLLPRPRTPAKFDDGWLRTGDVGTHHP